jgi:hypothetical protein
MGLLGGDASGGSVDCLSGILAARLAEHKQLWSAHSLPPPVVVQTEHPVVEFTATPAPRSTPTLCDLAARRERVRAAISM